MPTRTPGLWRSFATALAVYLATACDALGAGPLAGRWRLAEQARSERGAPSLVPGPVARLECAGAGDGVRCMILSDETPPRAFAWPAFVSGGRPLPIRIEARAADDARGLLSARYRVELPSGDGQSLLVTERYQVMDDRAALAGTVEITLLHDGESKGTLRFHRRFAREP